MSETECFRCGDVLLYCRCMEEWGEERTALLELGLDPDRLHPWEVQVPTTLELVHRGRDPSEREHWLQRYRAVRETRRSGNGG